MGNESFGSANLIIGGTIKAATSSVFTYLSAHPEICGSSVKETLFFTHQYVGCPDQDIECYKRYFNSLRSDQIAVEASPNYLAYTENVAPKIKALLPNAKLLFILRNPVDRFYSYYNFALGKLELPETLAFEEYIGLCEQYSLAKLTPEEAGIAEKHLRALEIGKYSKYLQNYFDLFSADQIKVAFYDDLKDDPVRFLADLCQYMGVDPDFYKNYTLNKVNVTFSARKKGLHRVAMWLNHLLESVLRQRPGIKMRLVWIYKQLNQDREGYVPMSDSTRLRLKEIYSKSNDDLGILLPGQGLPKWVS